MSSVTIKSSVIGDGTHGGFVAAQGSTLTIKGCLFNGKLLSTGTTATDSCGGFVGWSGGTVNISNSLFAPAALGTGKTWVGTDDSYTFSRRSGDNITNCYYTQPFGTAQGKQARSITAGENVTVANAGTATGYTVSGITAYPVGILYGENLYAGSGDAVSLTLSNNATDAPFGYQNVYTANGLTPNPSPSGEGSYSLVMPNEDVTISIAVRSDGQSYNITYMTENGTTDTHDAIALDETMNSLATNQWYFVGKEIDYTQTLTLNGDVNLILADGATLNIGTQQNPISSGDCISSETNQMGFLVYSLTIYGQSTDPATAGTLNAYGSHNESVAIWEKGYSQHGGNVNLNTTRYKTIIVYNGFNNGDLTLTRGTLTVTATSGLTYAIYGDLALSGNATVTWENFRAHFDFNNDIFDFTTLDPGRGYIIRHSGATAPSLTSEREQNVHYQNCTVTLSASGPGDLKGFNLIGNPYPHSLPCARPYYSLNPNITPNGIAGNGTKSLPPLPGGFCPGGQSDGDNGFNGFNGSNGRFAYLGGEGMVITQPGHLEGYDAIGRRLFSIDLDIFPTTLPTSLFPATGAYVLRLDGQSRKIIIK